jgi:Putative ATP-dependent DNA helicase recG C-terminal
MSRRVVYVVCAEGEEAQAELLAAPLRRAGYDIKHNGTIAVGESLIGEAERAVASGAPVILCGTAKAVGSTWAHRLTNAAHAGGRVFVVQMERQAHVEQLSLGGKVARYCDDPDRATDEIIRALSKNYPPTFQAADRNDEQLAAGGMQFLDQPTTSVVFDIESLERFRAELRREIQILYPRTITPWDFLDRAGLRIEGQLTRTGALLFAKDPGVVCSTAMVKCARYYGDDRAAVREVETFEGTVPEQIVAARQFVADRVRSGEAPSAEQAQSATFYEYPMVAVREIIANALVHRDYASTHSCVHVRLFSDRLEVSSPGSWLGRQLRSNAEYNLSELDGQSMKRNFRLAHVLSWIKLVEGEGSGIPSALRACEDMRAREPTVKADDSFITVVLYPAGQLVAKSNTVSGPAADVNSQTDNQSEENDLEPQGSLAPQRARRNEESHATEQLSRVALWGPPESGKSTFLSGLFIAATRSSAHLLVRGINDNSTDFLIRNTSTLTAQHRFPSPTSEQSLSWTLQMSVPNRARSRLFRPVPPTMPFDLRLDLYDPPGRAFAGVSEAAPTRLDLGDHEKPLEAVDYLDNCQGLLLLIDPVRERQLGNAHEYIYGPLLRMAQRERVPAGQRLPHYVAVCVAKFDDPSVFQFARAHGFLSYSDDDPLILPRVHNDEAEQFARELLAESDVSDFELLAGALRQYFYPDRIRFFITSAVGFYVGSSGQFREDDYQNVVQLENGAVAIRGPIHPINVAEPLLWLGRRIAAGRR